MRISDWSSDVCSSDLAPGMLPAGAGHPALAGPDGSAYPRLPGDPATVVATRIGADGRSGKDVATEIDQMIALNQVETRVSGTPVTKLSQINTKTIGRATGSSPSPTAHHV